MSAAPVHLLGIDLGSSSARAFIYDARGVPLAGRRVPYAWTVTPDGGLEIEAGRLGDVTVEAIDGAVAHARERSLRIDAVGLSTFWHGILGVDRDLRPVTPVFSWGDTRATAAAAVLRERIDARAFHARTGAYVHPSFPAVKLFWLAEAAPEAVRATRWWISPGELLAAQFCGVLRESISMASASGMFDQNALDWDDEIVSLLPIGREHLLPVGRETTIARSLAPAFARRWPELDGVPWLAPAGDGACANIGSGCAVPDAAALSIGTTAAVRIVREAPRVTIPPDLFCYRLDGRRFVLGGATSNGGNVYAWARRTLRFDGSGESVDAALAAMEPVGHGLVVDPSLAGERSPEWPLGARAAIEGVSLATTPLEIFHAMLEGVGRRVARIRGAVRAHAPESETVVASGRALTESRAFARIVCDMLGEPLHVVAFGETSSRGAALLAGEAIGAVEIANVPRLDAERIEPDMARHARYR